MLLCQKPPIERNSLNIRTVNALLRAGLAKANSKHPSIYKDYRGLVIDWLTIKERGDTVIMECRNLGVKGYEKVIEWLSVVESQYPEILAESVAQQSVQSDGACALPDCEVCRKFHLNNHGGLS